MLGVIGTLPEPPTPEPPPASKVVAAGRSFRAPYSLILYFYLEQAGQGLEQLQRRS